MGPCSCFRVSLHRGDACLCIKDMKKWILHNRWPLTFSPSLLQTPMDVWPFWTRWVRRFLAVKRRCVADSPTPSTRRLSSSRWRCSSCRTSPCWSPSITDAAWSAKRWWDGSLWVRTAAERRSRSTGRIWRRVEDSKSAAGTSYWRRKIKGVYHTIYFIVPLRTFVLDSYKHKHIEIHTSLMHRLINTIHWQWRPVAQPSWPTFKSILHYMWVLRSIMDRNECFRKICSLPNVLKIWLKCAQYLDTNLVLASVLPLKSHVTIKFWAWKHEGREKWRCFVIQVEEEGGVSFTFSVNKPMIDSSIANRKMWLNHMD